GQAGLVSAQQEFLVGDNDQARDNQGDQAATLLNDLRSPGRSGIVAPRMPWMAASQTAKAQRRAADHAVSSNRAGGELGAGGNEAADARHERRHEQAIGPYQREDDPARDARRRSFSDRSRGRGLSRTRRPLGHR